MYKQGSSHSRSVVEALPTRLVRGALTSLLAHWRCDLQAQTLCRADTTTSAPCAALGALFSLFCLPPASCRRPLTPLCSSSRLSPFLFRTALLPPVSPKNIAHIRYSFQCCADAYNASYCNFYLVLSLPFNFPILISQTHIIMWLVIFALLAFCERFQHTSWSIHTSVRAILFYCTLS